ncbi:hypothetical protein Y032_0009g418 [Ancylostoma ceylanicum]|uniref:Peroxin/Ferlin domain-containing protein n=2 Tax=Ancylostoma ceylanicum TaxID=53326 RepID=A0A016VHJ9_9BILA|nr:hypothetical protein Y032_0009g418 [Ancylostoma ceylanicum]
MPAPALHFQTLPMGNGYLWLLSGDGVPYRVTADNKIEHISDAQWKPEPVSAAGKDVKIYQIVGAPHAAFALDYSGAVYQFVLSSHLTIRQKVEIYSNQRWYPMIGWSSRTLPTDRASFSNEDGSCSVEMTGFHLKSDGWRWEEPWIVDMDVRKHDKEGWEYATNFAGAVWKPENGVSSFVRRRRWKRHMRYTSLEKWAELSRSSEVIVELAVGGFNVLPEQECFLFALSKEGALLRRVGINANNPDGDYWHEIDGVIEEDERAELSKICCSPSSGTLLVLTWDGRMFIRCGITREMPDGMLWSCLSPPGSRPVAFVSLGSNSVWTTSVDGKLWMGRMNCWPTNHEPIHSAVHFSEVAAGVYGMCLNEKDQLVGVSDTGVVYVREGISSAEPAGRAFLKVVERTSSEPQTWAMVSNAGTEYTNLPKHWVSDHVVIASTSHYRDTKWRKQILEDLCAVNDSCWEAFKSMNNDLGELIDDDVKSESWNHKVRAKLRLAGERRFITGTIYLGVEQLIFQANTGVTIVKPLSEVTSAVREFDAGTSTFTIRTSFCDKSLELGFSEESDRDEWHESLEQVNGFYHKLNNSDVQQRFVWRGALPV